MFVAIHATIFTLGKASKLVLLSLHQMVVCWCLSNMVCKDTICLRASEMTYTERLRVGELCSGMAVGAYMNAHAAAATEAHGTLQQMRPKQPYGGLAATWVDYEV